MKCPLKVLSGDIQFNQHKIPKVSKGSVVSAHLIRDYLVLHFQIPYDSQAARWHCRIFLCILVHL